MNNLRNGSAFPGEAMDTRQAPARYYPKAATYSGVINQWFSLTKEGSSSISERLTSETETVGRFSSHRTRQIKSTFTTNGEYEKTRQEITSLLYVQEDEDFVRPTRYALDLALNLLENANAQLVIHGTKFPRGTSSTSERGGIHVFWEDNGKSIQLEVPPRDGGMLYIHVISLDESVMNKDVSANALADALADIKLLSRRLGTKNVPASAAAR